MDTYKVKVKCNNCEYQNNHLDKLEIPKGQSVHLTSCPECLTLNLIKKET